MRVLLVEDDPLVADGIKSGLRLLGLTVDHADTVSRADAALNMGSFNVCVLDLGLPDGDGRQLLSRWRARGMALPILVLTARDAVHHRIDALTIGADDYMVKPFDLDELAARLHALVRRSAGRCVDIVQHGRLRFASSTGQAWLDAAPVDLSRREISLLRAFLQNPGLILSSDQLRESLYGFDDEIGSNALNVHIHHLRRKLGPRIIETVRGLGYRLGKAGE